MQITETSSEGLKRTLQVVVPAGELGKRFDDRLDEIKGRVQLKGFRKGKVPLPHLKKMYGRSLMVEVLQETVRDTSNQALTDRKLRPAMQPNVALPEDQAEIERVLSGESDLSYSMTFEVLPAIELVDFTTLKLERQIAEVDDESLEKAMGELLDRGVTYAAEEGRVAAKGDRVTIDYVGKIDGEAFEGGSTDDAPIVLGEGNFIPGFEDGLIGAKAGEEREVAANFPADYPAEHLAGKNAVFSVKVKEVAAPVRPELNDEFAKSLGAESVDQLKDLVKAQIAHEYANITLSKLKRQLLDQLDKAHNFELPPSLVDSEFEGIWQQRVEGMKRAGSSPEEAEGQGEEAEKTRAEFRRIAERRVRLGLIIGEIADKNEIKITQEELRQALIEQARRFPGQEKAVYDYYQNTPGALNELRGPIFEDKVVHFVIEKAQPADTKVSREELFKRPEEGEA